MNEENKFAEVKVFRFDPTVDKEPRYETYRAPYEGYNVYNVLQYIYENHDRSLAFRGGCSGKGGGRCGACPVLVNGNPALSCQRLATDKMVIEPHPKFELIKDLVVDFKKVKDYTYAGQKTVEVMIDQSKCVGCNDCVVICPVSVWKLEKVDKKYKAIPADSGSCCGTTCKMCESWCWVDAITIKPLT
ncbi:2Fe-2S iron-sulfur cluster-binding protein [Chloroflexota bacterium]